VLTDGPDYLACEDGDGDGCVLLDRLCPGGVMPALLVGVVEVLGLGAGDEGLAELDGAGGMDDPSAPPAVPG
jgi:hypothetical protein